MRHHNSRAAIQPPPGQFVPTALFAALILAWSISAAQAAAGIATVPAEQIRALVRDFTAAQYEADTEIAVGHLDPRLNLTACADAPEVFALAADSRVGNTAVGVRCVAPKPWTVYVPVTVTTYRDVVSAAHALARGTPITEADIRIARRAVTSQPDGAVNDSGQVVGKVMARSVTAGTVITAGMVVTPKIVRRGQTLTLVARSGGIEVRSSGRALADAAEGDRVRVENATSKRIVEGTVLADSTIRVDL